MFTRRHVILTGLALPLTSIIPAMSQSDDVAVISDAAFPSLSGIDSVRPFGSYPPDAEAVKKARELAAGAPNGNDPLRVVRYFIGKGKIDPASIAQTPSSEAWNPLILEFFTATDYNASNDMVPWCAAFANWVLKRTGKPSSGKAGSQSFLDKGFKKTTDPKVGDLAVFTCYNPDTGKSVGLGHVSFVAAKPSGGKILVAGGNQSNEGRSLICEKYYPLGPVDSMRTIKGKRTPVVFKINTFVALS